GQSQRWGQASCRGWRQAAPVPHAARDAGWPERANVFPRQECRRLRQARERTRRQNRDSWWFSCAVAVTSRTERSTATAAADQESCLHDKRPFHVSQDEILYRRSTQLIWMCGLYNEL